MIDASGGRSHAITQFLENKCGQKVEVVKHSVALSYYTRFFKIPDKVSCTLDSRLPLCSWRLLLPPVGVNFCRLLGQNLSCRPLLSDFTRLNIIVCPGKPFKCAILADWLRPTDAAGNNAMPDSASKFANAWLLIPHGGVSTHAFRSCIERRMSAKTAASCR